jgi:small-conductance mechanosensitive channel
VLGSLTERRLLGRTRLTAGARYAVGRITNYLVLVLGLATSLELLGVQLGSLTVLLGAVGVGIGFGLQNVVNNFVSGLLLLVERPLQIGDLVELEGARGRVTRIGGRSTTVRTAENIAIVVPNGDLIANKLTNWTQADPKTRLSISLRLDVGTDLERLKPLLLALAVAHTRVLKQPEPQVSMRKFDETGIDLDLQVWIDTRVTQPAGVISDLYFGCYQLYQEHDFHVPRALLNVAGAERISRP